MPQEVALKDKDDYLWINHDDTLVLLQASEVKYVPVDRLIKVQKGWMLFNDTFQVKGFLWSSKPEAQLVIKVIQEQDVQLFMIASSANYLKLAVGSEANEKGVYSQSEGSDEYYFYPKTIPSGQRNKK